MARMENGGEEKKKRTQPTSQLTFNRATAANPRTAEGSTALILLVSF